MPKLDWIGVVDRALDVADRTMDRFRKTPRRRLAEVPTPKVPDDPFTVKPAAKAAAPSATGAAAASPVAEPDAAKKPELAPLGDAGLLVQIYGRRTCDASGFTVKLLQGKSIPARMIDMDDEDHRDLEARLIKETKSYVTPYVFLRGVYVGGFDQIAALDKSGELDRRLFEKDV